MAQERPGAIPRNESFQPFLFVASHDEYPRLASHLDEAKKNGMQSSVDEAYRVGMYLLKFASVRAPLRCVGHIDEWH